MPVDGQDEGVAVLSGPVYFESTVIDGYVKRRHLSLLRVLEGGEKEKEKCGRLVLRAFVRDTLSEVQNVSIHEWDVEYGMKLSSIVERECKIRQQGSTLIHGIVRRKFQRTQLVRMILLVTHVSLGKVDGQICVLVDEVGIDIVRYNAVVDCSFYSQFIYREMEFLGKLIRYGLDSKA